MALRCLWLTRLLPYPPSFGGDFIYSSHLIESIARAGVEVTVLCTDNGGRPPAVAGVGWRVAPASGRRAAFSLGSPLPAIAYRSSTKALEGRLRDTLSDQVWDAVVFDNVATGWALDLITQAVGSQRPAFVYVSHNHEESVRRQLASKYKGSPVQRWGLSFDALKARLLERRLVDAADLVTVNTREDESLFRERAPEKSFLVVTPGYDGAVNPKRRFTTDLPRRAVLVGSFGWIGKQQNLLAFLRAAAPRFRAAGAEIEVLGSMPSSFARELRDKFPRVRSTQPAGGLAPYLRRARIGVVPEEIGGGFRHKVLEFVFNRVPVAAVSGCVAGTPLLPGESILEYADLPSLAEGVLQVMDDFDLLARMESAAFDACSDRFDWSDRGEILAHALAELADYPLKNRSRSGRQAAIRNL